MHERTHPRVKTMHTHSHLTLAFAPIGRWPRNKIEMPDANHYVERFNSFFLIFNESDSCFAYRTRLCSKSVSRPRHLRLYQHACVKRKWIASSAITKSRSWVNSDSLHFGLVFKIDSSHRFNFEASKWIPSKCPIPFIRSFIVAIHLFKNICSCASLSTYHWRSFGPIVSCAN